jgi:hypothetical protein
VCHRTRLDLRRKLLTMQELREPPRLKGLSELAYKCSPADACAPSDTAAAQQFRIAKMIANLTRKNLIQRGGNAKSQGTYRSHYTGATELMTTTVTH